MNNHFIAIFVGVIMPFIGTTLGACVVLLFKNKINEKFNKRLRSSVIRDFF